MQRQSKVPPPPIRQDDIFRRIQLLADSHVDFLDKAQVQAEARNGSASVIEGEEDGLPPTVDVPPFLEPPPSVVQLIFIERNSPHGAPSLDPMLMILNEKDQRRALRHFEKSAYAAAGCPAMIPGAVQRRMHERDPELSARRRKDLLEEAERRYQQVKTRLSKIIHHNRSKADPEPEENNYSPSATGNEKGAPTKPEERTLLPLNASHSPASARVGALMVPSKASLLTRKFRGPQTSSTPQSNESNGNSGSPPRTLPPLLHKGDPLASPSKAMEETPDPSSHPVSSESRTENGDMHPPLTDSSTGGLISSADWLAQKQKELKKLREGISTSLGWGLSRAAPSAGGKGVARGSLTDSTGTTLSDKRNNESFLPPVESPLRRNRSNPHRLPAGGGSVGGRLGLDEVVLLAEEPKPLAEKTRWQGSGTRDSGPHREVDGRFNYSPPSSPSGTRQTRLPSLLAGGGANVARDRSAAQLQSPPASPSRAASTTNNNNKNSSAYAYVQGISQWEASQRVELETECLEIMSLLFASAKYKLNLCR